MRRINPILLLGLMKIVSLAFHGLVLMCAALYCLTGSVLAAGATLVMAVVWLALFAVTLDCIRLNEMPAYLLPDIASGLRFPFNALLAVAGMGVLLWLGMPWTAGFYIVAVVLCEVVQIAAVWKLRP